MRGGGSCGTSSCWAVATGTNLTAGDEVAHLQHFRTFAAPESSYELTNKVYHVRGWKQGLSKSNLLSCLDAESHSRPCSQLPYTYNTIPTCLPCLVKKLCHCTCREGATGAARSSDAFDSWQARRATGHELFLHSVYCSSNTAVGALDKCANGTLRPRYDWQVRRNSQSSH